MPQRVLSELGTNCTQTSTTITLNKSDLGLTVPDASLDQILAAIVIKAQTLLTSTQFNAESAQNIYIEEGFKTTAQKNDNSQWILRSKTIYFGKLDTDTGTMNPNEY